MKDHKVKGFTQVVVSNSFEEGHERTCKCSAPFHLLPLSHCWLLFSVCPVCRTIANVSAIPHHSYLMKKVAVICVQSVVKMLLCAVYCTGTNVWTLLHLKLLCALYIDPVLIWLIPSHWRWRDESHILSNTSYSFAPSNTVLDIHKPILPIFSFDFFFHVILSRPRFAFSIHPICHCTLQYVLFRSSHNMTIPPYTICPCQCVCPLF